MIFSPHKTRVGVLRGGPSDEYSQSLETGKLVIDNLPEEYEPVDILVSKNGVWHTEGLERRPENVLQGLDVVWNALHGTYGEDGKVQRFLRHFGVPQIGSKEFGSALGMNKILSKKYLGEAGLKSPIYLEIRSGEEDQNILSKIHNVMPFPVMVKPVSSGSSFGLSVAYSAKEALDAIKKAFAFSPTVMVEEYIKGKEVSSGTIEGFRGDSHYALIPTSLSDLSLEESRLVQESAVKAHRALGLSGFSSSDFIVHPKRGVFILEVNTIPKFKEKSGFLRSLQSAGSSIKEFISHILSTVKR
ncbi:MAG: hypothetical protein AAB392_02970 [Patescibacteria group bacterium]